MVGMRRDYKAARVNLMGAYFKLPTRITSKYLNESFPIPEKQYCALGSSIIEIQNIVLSSRWSERLKYTVPFRSIRPSRAAHLGGLVEIETVSHVTGQFWAIFRACEGSGSPRRERRAPYKAGHTPG